MQVYYHDITYNCPKCGKQESIYQAWGNVTTFHYVDTVDVWGNADMTEISEAEFRKSDRDGFYCAGCFEFITYDLLGEFQTKPELFNWEKTEE